MADFEAWVLPIASWLGTFVVHSTALILFAFACGWLGHRVSRRFAGHEETLLRLAMFGALFTASVQWWSGAQALPGLAFDLQARPRLDAAPLTTVAPTALVDAGTLPPTAEALTMSEALAFALLGLACLVLLTIAFRARAWIRFRRSIAARRPVAAPELLALLTELRQCAGIRARVRLTTSDRLPSPVAFGFLRLEICVPHAVLSDMDAAQQECVLAHEMAHLRDRDPLWLALYELWTSLFLLQPLLLLARRRLLDLAEYRCDAWVVDQTGDRVGMAKALVAVAEWLTCRENRPCVVAPAMALGESALAGRVRRILDPDTDPMRPRWWTAPIMAVALSSFGCVPGVRLAAPGDDPTAATAAAAATAIDAPARTPVQDELIVLERQIADLHTQLAETWRLLEGRDLPEVTALLRRMQIRLARMTDERARLWREASTRAMDDKRIPRARWNPDSKDNR